MSRQREAVATAIANGWTAFDQTRDVLATLGPPSVRREDLAGSWRLLAEWTAERMPAEEQAAVSAAAGQRAAVQARTQVLEDAAAACAAAGVVGVSGVGGAARPDRPLGEIVAAASAGAAAAVTRLEEALAEAGRLRAEAGRSTEQAQVARALATHLRSTGFEKWLLDEVLDQLVAGATGLLRELSGGAYSLTLDEHSGFAVIDHRNADAVRSACTLSGGETFLASLALALALADRLAGFGTVGARLEAIFLDEGFGTLDPDTLDTVAAAIENLAAGGRVVAIVTHVRELADRIPARFEVEKGPATSTVRRWDG